MSEIRVLQMGLGPIGRLVTRYLLERGGFEVVAAVDADMGLIGLDLGDLARVGPMGVKVSGTVQAGVGCGRRRCGCGLHNVQSESHREAVPAAPGPQATHRLYLRGAGLPLGFPARAGQRIDAAARQAGVAILGVGVNPGFLMDLSAGGS